MVAYSFNKRFIEPILEGSKRQTIRPVGKRRHARRGDDLQLFCGLRTRQCRRIGSALCLSIAKVTLTWRERTVSLLHDDGGFTRILPPGFDEFAQGDGFADGAAMAAFWEEHHTHPFEGVLVRWIEFRPADSRVGAMT